MATKTVELKKMSGWREGLSHQYGKEDEEEGRVAATQSVHEVVVVTNLELPDLCDRSHNLEHRH